MPESVLILHDRCRLNLALPIYFEEQSLDKVRKVFKLLGDRMWQNDKEGGAIETLDQFFPAWRQELKDRLDRTAADLLTATQDAEEKRRAVAVMGSALDEQITQAKNRVAEGKKWLAHEKRRRKARPDEISKIKEQIKQLEELLKAAMRPKNDHQAAVKEVKRLEKEVKAAKAAIERGSKVISAYEALKA